MSREQQLLEETGIVSQMRLGGASEDEVFDEAQAKDLFQYLTERIVPMDLARSVSPDFHQDGNVVATVRKALGI